MRRAALGIGVLALAAGAVTGVVVGVPTGPSSAPRPSVAERAGRGLAAESSPVRGAGDADAKGSTSAVAAASTDGPVVTRPVPSVLTEAAPVQSTVDPTAGSGSPWEVFTGHLSGPTQQVAHVRSPGLNVSIHQGEAPYAGLSPRTPLGAERVLLVVRDEGDWLQVLLPLRPNNSVGWILRGDVDVTTVTHRVEINRAAHRMQVFDNGHLILDQPVAVGKKSTPTPTGQFFVTELLQTPNSRGAYGPFAFVTSAYSNVYQTFGSGDGSVGLHGTNEPSSIGRDASHGCVRIANDTISWLASFLPLGTPFFIQ